MGQVDMSDDAVQSRDGVKLMRKIGFLGVFSVAAGAMISSGLFVLPGMAFAQAGPAVVLSYALAGLMIIPAMMAQAELATAMPKAGGTYFFIERSLGPLAGTIAGLLDWFSIALKAAFALVGIGAAVALLFPDASAGEAEFIIRAVAACGCVVFMFLNLAGAHESVRLQNALVVFLIAAVALYILLGAKSVEINRFAGFSNSGWSVILAVSGMVFVSYGGLTKVIAIAEEVKDPGRNITWGMFTAFAVVNVLYVAAIAITVGVVPADTLSGSLAPLAQGAGLFAGKAGTLIIELAALAAFVTTANAGLLSASRSPMAMSHDGFLPEWFGRISERTGVPKNSVIFTTIVMFLLIVFLDIEDLVKTASTMMILLFLFGNVALIIMRRTKFQSYRPLFKAPAYPWLQLAAIIVYIVLILGMGLTPVLLTLGFSLAACVWYLAYLHKRLNREGALAYLLKQSFGKEDQRQDIENELVRIALERDEKDLDRFDRLVQRCWVIDVQGGFEAKEFFGFLAGAFAETSGLMPTEFYNMLLEREKNSSTVITPGLAIPHLIIPGEGKFVLAMVRAKDGIVYDELHKPVNMAFVLLGTEDQRNFHLKSLMNIAHIVQEPEFEDRWFAARSVDELRDLVILTRKNR